MAPDLLRSPAVPRSHLHDDVSGTSTDSDSYFKKRVSKIRESKQRENSGRRNSKKRQPTDKANEPRPIVPNASQLTSRPRKYRLSIGRQYPHQVTPRQETHSAHSRPKAATASGDAKCHDLTTDSSVYMSSLQCEHYNRAPSTTAQLSSLKYALKRSRIFHDWSSKGGKNVLKDVGLNSRRWAAHRRRPSPSSSTTEDDEPRYDRPQEPLSCDDGGRPGYRRSKQIGRGHDNVSICENNSCASSDLATPDSDSATDSDDVKFHIRSVLGYTNHTVTYDCPRQRPKEQCLPKPVTRRRLVSSPQTQRYPTQERTARGGKRRPGRATDRHQDNRVHRHGRLYRTNDEAATCDYSRHSKTADEYAYEKCKSAISSSRTNEPVNKHNMVHSKHRHRADDGTPADDHTFARALRHAVAPTHRRDHIRPRRGASDASVAVEPRRQRSRRDSQSNAGTARTRPRRCSRRSRPVDVVMANGHVRTVPDDAWPSDTSEDEYRSCKTSPGEVVSVNYDSATSSTIQTDDDRTTDFSAEGGQPRHRSRVGQVSSRQTGSALASDSGGTLTRPTSISVGATDTMSDGSVSSHRQLIIDLVIEPRHPNSRGHPGDDDCSWTLGGPSRSSVVDAGARSRSSARVDAVERSRPSAGVDAAVRSWPSVAVDDGDSKTSTTFRAPIMAKCRSAPCTDRDASEEHETSKHRVTSYHSSPAPPAGSPSPGSKSIVRPSSRDPQYENTPYRDVPHNARRRLKIIREPVSPTTGSISDEAVDECNVFREPRKTESMSVSMVSDALPRTVHSHGDAAVADVVDQSSHRDVSSPPQQAVTGALRPGIMKVVRRNWSTPSQRKSTTFELEPPLVYAVATQSSQTSCYASQSPSVERMEQCDSDVTSRGSSPVSCCLSLSSDRDCVQQRSSTEPRVLKVDKATSFQSENTYKTAPQSRVQKTNRSAAPIKLALNNNAAPSPTKFRFSHITCGRTPDANNAPRETSLPAGCTMSKDCRRLSYCIPTRAAKGIVELGCFAQSSTSFQYMSDNSQTHAEVVQ